MSSKATQGNKTGDGPQSAIRDPQSRQKILIVDDRKENLVALRQALAGVDAEIIEARSGNEALAATLDRHFAVAILDVMMPEMSGYELAEHLRCDDQTKVIPIVFVTASYADEQHMFKGYEAGGVDYIIKPFDPKVLLSKVRVFLELDRYREDLRQHRDELEALVGVRTVQLRERIRETQCLYAVSSLVAKPCESIHEALRTAVDLIPAGLQYPEIACARIRFEGREFAAASFKETPWSLSAEITSEYPELRVPDSVQVCYLEERPDADEGPFLKEERHLVNDIARQLGVMIERERWMARERHLSVVLRSIRDVNQLIVHERRRERLIQAICESLVRTRGFQGSWIVLNDRLPDGVDSAQVGFTEANFAALADRLREGRPPRCCGRNEAGEVLVAVRDPSVSCDPCPLAQAYGGNSALTVGLRHEDREFGWLGVSVPLSYVNDEQEASLLREIAGDIAFALHGIEMESERRKSEETLRAIFESASDGILLADAESGRFVRANDAICRMLGYSCEEIEALCVADIHPPEALDSVRAQFERQARGEIILAADLPVKRKDGTVFLADVSSAPFELEGRRHLVGIFRDITERKRAEEALRESERALKKAQQIGCLGSWEWDIASGRLTWSDELFRIWGVTKDFALTQDNITSLIHPDDRERNAAKLGEIVDSAANVQFEFRIIRPDGANRTLQQIVEVSRDGVGKAVRAFGTMQDITERKRAEEALRRFERAVESSSDAVGMSTPQGKHYYQNKAFDDMFGEVGEDPPATLYVDEAVGREAFETIISGREWTREVRMRGKGGNTLDILLRAYPMKDGQGAITGLVGVHTDITAQRSMEAQLRQAQKLESIGTLAGGVAHEINNPVMGIMNYAQLILDKLGPDSPVAEFATEIGKETERVAAIVKNLLSFARVEKQTHSPARMCDIVEGTLSLVRTVLRHDQITLEVDVPEDLPKIKCRSQQIQQVVMNLITNARDALNEKYPGYHEDKKILVRAELGTGCVRLTVEDHGLGIPEGIRERIFDPFFTTKPRDRGTGLGLSISHGIVRDHQGELSMESEFGEWTQFHIDLPVDNGWELEREQGGKRKAKEKKRSKGSG